MNAMIIMSLGPLPVTLDLDTNLLYDKAEVREGSCDFDAIVDLARSGQVALFFTATTDFEDKSGAAMRLVLALTREGILREAPNAGTHADFMPGGPGLHVADDAERDRLLRCIRPTGS